MKLKKFTLLAFSLTVVFGLIQVGTVHTNITQPPVGHTGAPNELTCGRIGCHTQTPATTTNALLATVPTGGLNSGYTPGTQYNLSLNVNSVKPGGAPRYGFELTALDGSNNAAGTFALSSTTTTSLSSFNGRQYVGHKNANSTAAWAFKWTAPSAGTGDVTFYIAVNAANGNGSDSGDNIYLEEVVVQESTGVTCTSNASFTVSVSGDTATVTNTSTGVFDSFAWDFGNGTTGSSTATVQTVVYSAAGNYTIALTATDTCGSVYNASNNITIGAVGISENTLDNCQVYPNPVHGELTIDLSNTGIQQGEAKLYDLSGRVVARVELNADQVTRLERGSIDKGLYILQLSDDEGHMSTRKVSLD